MRSHTPSPAESRLLSPDDYRRLMRLIDPWAAHLQIVERERQQIIRALAMPARLAEFRGV